jgi:hypothetical protein
MRGKLSVAAALAAACWCTPATSSAALLINEVDSDTANVPSTDFAEFVELYDSSGGSVPLDGFVLIFYNGSNDRAYAGFDLDGFSTSATGYFVAGAVAGAQLAITSNTIQNGADSIALYQGDLSSFVTTNNTSATLITAPPAGPILIDAVVYDTGADTDGTNHPGAMLLSGGVVDEFGPTQDSTFGANNSIGRDPNGSGDARSTLTYTNMTPTPGAANVVPEPASLSLLAAGALLLGRRRRRA